MKRLLVLATSLVIGTIVCGDSACQGPFPRAASGERLEVTVTDGPATSPTARRALSFTAPDTYTVTIRALTPEGQVDTSFNGYVRLSSQPGTVQAVTGANTDGRNVQLQSGTATGVQVQLVAAYGNTFIQAEDVGYTPADPARVCSTAANCPPQCKVGQPCPPQCANGVDDNDNGLVDYPTDPGCYLANDDSEGGGTYSAGVSETLYYYIPRIADVNGAANGGTSGTPFPNQAVNINSGYRGGNTYDFSVVVTDVSASGFYATDIDEDAPGGGGFGSVFAYNYNAPPNMRTCDRLRGFGGTTAMFYGFVEVNYPTWELEEWDPTQRPCLVPPPHVIDPMCNPTGALIPCTGTGTAPCAAIAAQSDGGVPDGLTCVNDYCQTPNCVLMPPQGSNSSQMLSVAAALVRLQSTPGAPAPASFKWNMTPTGGAPNLQPVNPAPSPTTAGAGTIFHIGTLFGSAHPCGPTTCTGCCDATGVCHTDESPTASTCAGTTPAAAYMPTPDATNCDLDDSGKVDRTKPDELACANACAANVECSEYTNYASQNQFNLVTQVVTWKAGDLAPTVVLTNAIQANGSTDATFNPVLDKGLSLGAFTGTLYFFSGGSQFTIQARCQDDIVALGQPPIPSDTACVHARTVIDPDQGN
jgi:hypothetical protein